MSIQLGQGIGGELKLAIGVEPAARAAGTVNGPAIDRLGLDTAVLEAIAGAVTGAPSAQTLDVKLQQSADGSTGWTDFVPVTGTPASGAVAQVTTVSSRKRKTISLRKAQRYIRVVQTVGFTGGTAPTWLCAAHVVMAAPDTAPAQSDD